MLAALAVAGGATPAARGQGVPASPCPAVMPVSEIQSATAGGATLAATGLTVSRGDDPEPFTAEVLGVVEDGIGPDVDLILVRADSPTIDRVGGIWSGMSGSPVYAADGRLIGAVSLGFSAGPSRIAGLTPAATMMQVLDEAVPVATRAARRSVRLPSALARKAARHTALPNRQLTYLPLPVGVSGLRPARLEALTAALPARMGPVVTFRVAPPPVDPGDVARIRPGSNFAAAVSHGDVTFAGIGTTTAVCDGSALAFGHPLLFSGDAHASAHTATAITITEDPTFAPFKFANLGGVVGTVDQDRLTAVRARLGVAPAPVVISSSVVHGDRMRSRDGQTFVNDRSLLPLIAGAHLASNIERVIDRVGAGRSLVAWTVTGVADGEPFTLTRENRFAVAPAGSEDPTGAGDISSASAEELQADLAAIIGNPFSEVDFASVDIAATVRDRYRAYRIVALERLEATAWQALDPDAPVTVTPGELLRVRLRLSSYRNAGGTRFIERAVRVPRDLEPGTTAEISITGGAGAAGEDGPPADDPASFDDLLGSLRSAPRNDQIVAEVRVAPEGDEPPTTVASLRETLDEVVTGSLTFQVEVQPATP